MTGVFLQLKAEKYIIRNEFNSYPNYNRINLVIQFKLFINRGL